ncbi:MAG: hypothetical protein O9340_14260 [Cyclobacteriaceae bacterium]|jgi:hypothetical protein|nr:hypothetical protein [Cyclobacteriaceae bacterium]
MKLQKIALATLFALSVVACSEEDRITLKDAQDISEDALTDSYYEDADDLSTVALEADDNAEGGLGAARTKTVIVVDDSRFECATVTVTIAEDSQPSNPKGNIEIDFGTGCTDNNGNVRSGIINVAYEGRRFQPGSTAVLTTDNYFINSVKLEGTRTLTNVTESNTTSPKFNVTLVGGKATFPDGRVANREVDITREWFRNSTPTYTDDELRILEGSTASGVTRNGRNYTMVVEETIVFKRNCGVRFPVDGVKVFTVESKPITINYGDGECDRSVTYTVGDNTFTTNVPRN